MAFLGHQPGVYGELSGLENLRFFSRLHGHDTADKELERTLDGFELGRAARRPVQTYSRGMIQRLALARVSVQGADLWLLDEPMTGLDDAGRELFVKLLDGARQDGKTIVAVTHDPATLEAVADQKLVLKNGRLWGGDA
jgi:heme exporter protein A